MLKDGRFHLCIILVFATQLALGQQKQTQVLDSIKLVAGKSESLKGKVAAIHAVVETYEKSNADILVELSKLMMELSYPVNYAHGIGTALETRGFSYSLKAEYDSAIQNYKAASGYFSKDTSPQVHQARLYHDILVAFDLKGKVDSVYAYARLQLEEAEQSKDSIRIAVAKHDMGRYLYGQNNAQKAAEYLFDALRLVKGDESSEILINILHGIAITYRRLGNNSEAHRYFENSINIAARISIKPLQHYWLAHCYNQVANFYLTAKDSVRSKETIMLQLNHANLSGSLDQVYSTHMNQAWYYDNRELYGRAVDEYKTALNLQRSLKNKRSIGLVHYNLCATYYDIEKYQLAVLHGDSARRIFIEIGDAAWESDTYYNLGLAYWGVGNFKEAYQAMEDYANLSYTVSGEDNNRKIAQMQAVYESEKKDAAIALLNKENELINTQRKFYFVVAASLFAIALLAVYLFFQKQKSNNLLTEKNVTIEKSLHERETLLKEIHHRVKNNLQIISSLLSLQSKSLGDSAAQGAISESRNRVKSMSLIHEQLYQEDTISGVEMKNYISRLVSSLASSYGLDTERVEMKIEADDILLDVDSAIPLGLIINELVSNAMKYAFPGQLSGIILISLKDNANELLLMVKDDGVGIDDSKKSSQSFGLSMVNSLMRKLKAEINIVSQGGTSVQISIKDFKKISLA